MGSRTRQRKLVTEWGWAIAAGEKLAVMPKKKYIVTLTHSERQQLEQLTTKGKAAAYKVNHARILLLADTNRED